MPSTAQSDSGRRPLIYLVDDEPLLLDLAELVLQADGYEFRKFTDPVPALEALQQEPPLPDLLLTDYAMHSMNGIEFIRRCHAIAPGLKAILVSGTVDEQILLNAPVRVDYFLAKPYQTGELSALVRKVLRHHSD